MTLEEIAAHAIPIKEKDCHLVRGQKEHAREQLVKRIKVWHLEQLTPTTVLHDNGKTAK